MQKMTDTIDVVRSASFEVGGTRVVAFGGIRYVVPFTVTMKFTYKETGEPLLEVEGTVDERDGGPVLLHARFDSPNGWDLPDFQRWWSWSGLVQLGLELCRTEGTRAELEEFLAKQGRRQALTDGFLATIAARYIELGRGYAPQLAREHYKSPRTIISWVVLARERGLLTSPEGRGAVGGQLTPEGRRALRGEASRQASRRRQQ